MTSIYAQKGLKLPRLQHLALPVPDNAQEAIRAFYGGVLGLTEKSIPHTLAHLHLVWFAVGEGELELHFSPDPLHLADPEAGRHICFEVEDLEGYRTQLQAAGLQIIVPELIPHRPRFFCCDPFGNRLEFTTILGDYREAEELS